VIKLVILQRVCATYRVPLFLALNENGLFDLKLFIGDDIPGTKVRSSSCLPDIEITKHRTAFINLFGSIYVYHIRLLRSIMRSSPDVILCEGESNIFGYLKAILYKIIINNNVRLVHWSLGGVPGENEYEENGLKIIIKKILLSFFDSYIVYSSYGKEVMLRLGCNQDRVFVAVNVGDMLGQYPEFTTQNIRKIISSQRSQSPQRFKVIYVGSLDGDKRVDVLLDAMFILNESSIFLTVVGEGAHHETLQKKVHDYKLDNVSFVGHVTGADLAKYYLLSHLFVLPGRGGQVVSEAMFFSLPVVVYQADGTEYDLVQHNYNGVRLMYGDQQEIAKIIKEFSKNIDLCNVMGERGREIIKRKYNKKIMADNIVSALHFALKKKS